MVQKKPLSNKIESKRISKGSGFANVVSSVLKMEAQAILECESRWSGSEMKSEVNKAILKIAAILDKGGKIVVTGVGKSGKIAQKISATLTSTGSPSVFLHPTEALHGDMGLVTHGDVVLALSYTGNTEEMMNLLPAIEQRNVLLVVIAGRKDSKLARKAHFWLDAAVDTEACPHNLAPTSSTTLMLAIGDAIAVALMKKRGFKAKNFAFNHPGGSLGKRLTLKVKDIMVESGRVPICSPKAPFSKVIEAATQSRMGVVLVTEGKTLLGIITDGDIRRSLEHKGKVFEMKAAQIMTSNPTFTTPESMAQEALDKMQNREHQIKELPVVRTGTREWVGLVRLYDLLGIL